MESFSLSRCWIQHTPALFENLPCNLNDPDTTWNLFRLQYLEGEGKDELLPLPFVAPEYHAYLQLLRGHTFNFLGLPAEIRNKIYRYTLTDKTFTVKLQFKPFDTSLMRVNKQIYLETSSLFYHENSFRIPQSLFVGAPILDQLEKFYHLPRQRLSIMKRLLIDIPVHGLRSLSHLKDETRENVNTLAAFLSRNRKTKREIKIELNVGWGEEHRRLKNLDYSDLVYPWAGYNGFGDGNVEMCLQVYPTNLDIWVVFLEQCFPKKWRLNASLKTKGRSQRRYLERSVSKFRSRYCQPGLKELYEEIFELDTYAFSPRQSLAPMGK